MTIGTDVKILRTQSLACSGYLVNINNSYEAFLGLQAFVGYYQIDDPPNRA